MSETMWVCAVAVLSVPVMWELRAGLNGNWCLLFLFDEIFFWMDGRERKMGEEKEGPRKTKGRESLGRWREKEETQTIFPCFYTRLVCFGTDAFLLTWKRSWPRQRKRNSLGQNFCKKEHSSKTWVCALLSPNKWGKRRKALLILRTSFHSFSLRMEEEEEEEKKEE